MSGLGDAVRALRVVLTMQDDVRLLKDTAKAQSDRLAQLAEAHVTLRDRVSRLEGFIEGVGAAARSSGNTPRLER